MGIVNRHALGREQQIVIMHESSRGTYQRPTSSALGDDDPTTGGGMRVLESSIDPQQAFRPRDDVRGTRSAQERITGTADIKWSLDGYVLPSGTQGTPPDAHWLYRAALGAYANTPGTQDDYTLASLEEVDTLTITRCMSGVWSEALTGCWVEEMSIGIRAAEAPRVAFRGGAMGYIWTGRQETSGTVSGGSYTPGDDWDYRNVAVNSVVKVGTDDESDEGLLVTDVDYSTGLVTVDGTIASQTAPSVTPFVPAAYETHGSPISPDLGSMTLAPADGVSGEHPITGFDVTLRNNHRPHKIEAFGQYVSDVVPGYREVVGAVSLRMRSDQVLLVGPTYQLLGQRQLLRGVTMTLQLGSSGGSRCRVVITDAMIDWAAVKAPADGAAVVDLPFTAIATADEGEISLRFD